MALFIELTNGQGPQSLREVETLAHDTLAGAIVAYGTARITGVSLGELETVVLAIREYRDAVRATATEGCTCNGESG